MVVPRATYRPDEVESYAGWAGGVLAQLREELTRWAAVDPVTEAQLRAEDLVESARRQARGVLGAALSEMRRASGRPDEAGADLPPPAHLPPPPHGEGEGGWYDAEEVERYVAWVTATVARLRDALSVAQAGREPASAAAEVERIRTAATAEAAAIVAAARRQLADAVAEEQRRIHPGSASPVAPSPPMSASSDPRSGPSGTRSVFAPPAAPESEVTVPPPIDLREPVWARRGRWIRNTGVLLVLFVMYQLFGTNVEADRSQQRLMSAFTRQVGTDAAEDLPSATTTSTVPLPPLPGDAVAVIKIPKLGLEQAVVEGTSVADLRKGPGHYTGTPLPGEAGNAGIAGHRTTYGAPFGRIDELVPGDPILVQTKAGLFRYTVSGGQVVKPTRTDVLHPQGDNRLTLTTCHPKYSARQRYVVFATLSEDTPPRPAFGPPATSADPEPEPAELASSPDEEAPRTVADDSSSFHLAALPPTLFWGVLVIGASWLSRKLGRAWHRIWARVLTAPATGFALLESFQALSHFLPSNY